MPDAGSMPSSSGIQLRHSFTKTSVPGCCGDIRDRIIPVSVPSVCEIARSADCLPSQLLYVKAVIADSLASGPFDDFLMKKDCRNARLLLNFWRDAQVHYFAEALMWQYLLKHLFILYFVHNSWKRTTRK